MKRALFLVYVIVFIDLCGSTVMINVMPELAETKYGLSVNDQTYAFFFTSYSIAQVFSSYSLGKLSDLKGRRPSLLVSLFGSFGGFLFQALAPTTTMFLIARTVSGLLSGSVTVAMAYISDYTLPGQERSRYFSYFGVPVALSFFAGPLLGTFFGWTAGPTGPFYAMSIMSAMGLLFSINFLPEPSPKARRQEQQRWQWLHREFVGVARTKARQMKDMPKLRSTGSQDSLDVDFDELQAFEKEMAGMTSVGGGAKSKPARTDDVQIEICKDIATAGDSVSASPSRRSRGHRRRKSNLHRRSESSKGDNKKRRKFVRPRNLLDDDVVSHTRLLMARMQDIPKEDIWCIRQVIALKIAKDFVMTCWMICFTNYCREEYNLSSTMTGVVLSFGALIYCAAQLLIFPRAHRRFFAHKLILSGCALMAFGIALVGVFSKLPVGVTGTSALCFGLAFVNPASRISLSGKSTEMKRGEVLGWSESAAFVCKAVSPLVLTAMYAQVKELPFFIAGGATFLMTVCMFRVGKIRLASDPKSSVIKKGQEVEINAQEAAELALNPKLKRMMSRKF